MIALRSIEESEALGRKLGAVLRQGDVVTLSGALGAGKTSFARGILEGLGFAGEVPSPSFAVVIPYDEPGMRLPVWHADLYRIEAPAELDELGLEEGLATGALLVEWPERAGPARWPSICSGAM